MDIALRTLLISKGGRKGDRSRFAVEAVNCKVLRKTIHNIQNRNAAIAQDELDRLIDEEFGLSRRTFWRRIGAGRRRGTSQHKTVNDHHGVRRVICDITHSGEKAF
jgi:hypothetical protein